MKQSQGQSQDFTTESQYNTGTIQTKQNFNEQQSNKQDGADSTVY